MRWIELLAGIGLCLISLRYFIRWIEPSPNKNHLGSSILRFTVEVFLRLMPFYAGLVIVVYAFRQDLG